jgi:hypothetical protein
MPEKTATPIARRISAPGQKKKIWQKRLGGFGDCRMLSGRCCTTNLKAMLKCDTCNALGEPGVPVIWSALTGTPTGRRGRQGRTNPKKNLDLDRVFFTSFGVRFSYEVSLGGGLSTQRQFTKFAEAFCELQTSRE